MALKYSIIKNNVHQDTEVYKGRIIQGKSFTKEEIINRMVLSGSTLTEADNQAAVTLFIQVCEQIVSEGGHLNLPILHTHFTMRGKFTGPTDGYDPKRHQVVCKAVAGPDLKEATRNIVVQKVVEAAYAPHLVEVVDVLSGSINETITPGGVITIIGGLLKVKGDDPSVGVFFVDLQGTEHRAAKLVYNKPSQLIVNLPNLDKGIYQLEVRTQYTSSGIRKEVRKGTFAYPLTVS